MQSNKRLRKLLLQATPMPLRKLSPTVRAYPIHSDSWHADSWHACYRWRECCSRCSNVRGGAITQAGGLVENDDSLTTDNDVTLAGQIATPISQARLPPQVALQGYAYALSYSQNSFTGQTILNAVMSAGQLTPLLTQASVASSCLQAMWNSVHACVQHH